MIPSHGYPILWLILCRRQVKCAYSDGGNGPEYSASPIDVVAEVKSLKVILEPLTS